MKEMAALIFAAGVLGGCADMPHSSSTPPSHAVTDPGRAGVVLAVARARSDLDVVDGRLLWHGVYGGSSAAGCARVRLNQADEPLHQWSYLACGNQVREIDDVAPEPSRDTRIIPVLDSLSQAAWRTGELQKTALDGYGLEAEPVGPVSAFGCRLVDQRLIYQDVMVVDVREERVCGGMR